MSGYNEALDQIVSECAAGAFDYEPETEREHHFCLHPLCDEPYETECENCETRFCSDHGSKGGDESVMGLYLQAYPAVCWKCGGFNADEEVN